MNKTYKHLLCAAISIALYTAVAPFSAFADDTSATQAMQDTKASVENKAENMKDTASTKMDNAKDTASTKMENMKDTASTKMENMKDSASNAIDNAKDSMKNTAEEGKNAAQQLASDTKTSAEITKVFAENSMKKLLAKVSAKVKNGYVLLTGDVNSDKTKEEAQTLVEKLADKDKVFNHITVKKPVSKETYAKDTWITSQVKAKFLADSNTHSLDFNVVTVNGAVYLLGNVNNQKELDHALELVKQVEGVHKDHVVSHVTVDGKLSK